MGYKVVRKVLENLTLRMKDEKELALKRLEGRRQKSNHSRDRKLHVQRPWFEKGIFPSIFISRFSYNLFIL